MLDVKSINSVIPGLIYGFSVQLANKYFDNPDKLIGKSFTITTKIDGGRIIALKRNNKIKFYTRQGQEYIGLVELEDELLNCFPDNICLDGELVAITTDKQDTYKTTMKTCRTKSVEKHRLKMMVFDYMTADEFMNQPCNVNYENRRKYLDSLFSALNVKYFQLLPVLYSGTDTSQVVKLLEQQVNAGEEGIMININSALYCFDRTWNLMKVKKFNDTELKVVGFEEGSNKYSGTLGALLFEYKGNIVKVGSGFDDELRDLIWFAQPMYLGKYATVQYFSESKDSAGNISLRFPVFKDFRDFWDKNTPDF